MEDRCIETTSPPKVGNPRSSILARLPVVPAPAVGMHDDLIVGLARRYLVATDAGLRVAARRMLQVLARRRGWGCA